MKEVKIKTDLVNGRVVELKPNIFVFEIPDKYELAMLFCRHQEFYESPFKDIRGKNFSLEYYMNRYRKDKDKFEFTYPEDWAGFNIPSNSFKRGLSVFDENDNVNEYDEIIAKALLDIDVPAAEKFYLIGVRSIEQLSTLNHEFAHALYYTNKEYKKECKKLFGLIGDGLIKKAFEKLIEIGYANKKELLFDELQAYLSTGLISRLDFLKYETVLHDGIVAMIEKPFKENFDKFNR